MTRTFLLTLLFAFSVHAQEHRVEGAAAGIFPLAGESIQSYDTGPALRAGYELRFVKYASADIGLTGARPEVPSCNRFGCVSDRTRIRLLDYGLRGLLPLGERLELSGGFGGGYAWHRDSTASFFLNESLIQYSGRIAVGLDRGQRLRLAFGARVWRDLGRPTQQWLLAGGGVIYSFGRRFN